MPRRAREACESGIYHIMLRGIEKKDIFLGNQDKQSLLDIVEEKRKLNGFALPAYCIMDNHVHLLMKEKEETVSQSIKRIGTSYAHYYNKTYDRVGHLFQDRFKSEPVSSDTQLLEVFRYIHNNPVKAGLVSQMADYSWSSFGRYSCKPAFAENIGNSMQRDELTGDFEEVLSLLAREKMEAVKIFVRFCNDRVDNLFLDLDNSDKNYVNKRKAERIRALLQESGFVREEILNDGEKRKDLIRRLKFEEGLPVRQITEILGLNRNEVQRVKCE